MASVSTFSAGVIPIPELQSFYSLDNVTMPQEKRPYTWSMSVSTLDGCISFKDPGADGAKEVSLSHIKDSGSISDWRLLNAGWMYADAVMGSGSCLRAEPDILWIPHFDDMIDFRVNVLKKSKYPLNVILTGSGDLDLKHPIFNHPDLHTLIVTSKSGHERITKKGNPIPPNMVIEVISQDTKFDDQELKSMAALLLEKYHVKFLDVTAGGVVIAKLMKLKLVDEMRVTVAGQVCGDISSTGEKRPTLFSSDGGEPFTCHNNPLLEFNKIAVFGIHHIFLRSLIKYRH